MNNSDRSSGDNGKNPVPSSLHKAQRVGVFIDTQNLYHSARTLFKAHVNYKNLVEAAVGGRQLVRAFAYVIKSEAGDEAKFFEALTDLGIETRVKDLQVFFSGEKKADWDVGIAMDIVRMIEFKKLDAVVLVSGDGDFIEVLKYVKSRGTRAEVMAFKKTTSQKLVEESDSFLDMGADPRRFLIRTHRAAAAGRTPRTSEGSRNSSASPRSSSSSSSSSGNSSSVSPVGRDTPARPQTRHGSRRNQKTVPQPHMSPLARRLKKLIKPLQ